MLIVPFEVPKLPSGFRGRGPVVVVMIIERENLDRMKQADPFDLHFAAYRGRIPIDKLISDLDFVIAYEEDSGKILEFKEKNDLAGLLRWLERGRKIEPGDLALPVSVRKT